MVNNAPFCAIAGNMVKFPAQYLRRCQAGHVCKTSPTHDCSPYSTIETAPATANMQPPTNVHNAGNVSAAPNHIHSKPMAATIMPIPATMPQTMFAYVLSMIGPLVVACNENANRANRANR